MAQFELGRTSGEAESGVDRRSLLRLGAVAGAGLVVASSREAAAQAPPPPAGPRQQFQAIQRHENAHVTYLVNALGASARPKPTFQNLNRANLADFVTVSQALEATGVGAYLGATPVIFSKDYLGAAASIALIEAEHTGFLNAYRSAVVTRDVFGSEQTFAQALTIDQVVANAGPFVASLNGGPPLTFSTTPSANNDIAILNFALALEYLEAEFYNLNVPKFFA